MDDKQPNRDIVRAAQSSLPVLVRSSSLIRRTLTELKVRTEHPPFIVNSIGMKLMRIPAGQFMMGSPEGEEGRFDDETQHQVTISNGFYIGATQVTQAQWKTVIGTDPSHFKGDDLPVESLSWYDAVAFCMKLSEKEGKKYRLPTEAEWEYACRAGTTTPFSFGATISTDEANYAGIDTYGNGGKGVYRKKTIPVGSLKKPNKWGLHDMHGNVWEWCSDWHDYPNGAATDPACLQNGTGRVLRGGSWEYVPENCRSAFRYENPPGDREYDFGFRVVLDFSE